MERKIKIHFCEFTGNNPAEIIFLLATQAPAYTIVQDDEDRTYIVGNGTEWEIIEGDFIVCFASGYVESFRSEMFKAMFN